jgi:hypothetical protein
VLRLQVCSDFRKLSHSGLEVFDYFGGDQVAIGEIGAVFEAFVFEPKGIGLSLSRWEGFQSI